MDADTASAQPIFIISVLYQILFDIVKGWRNISSVEHRLKSFPLVVGSALPLTIILYQISLILSRGILDFSTTFLRCHAHGLSLYRISVPLDNYNYTLFYGKVKNYFSFCLDVIRLNFRKMQWRRVGAINI